MTGDDGIFSPVFTLIENAEVSASDSKGIQAVLLANDKIIKVEGISRAKLAELGVSCPVIDAKNNFLIPGLIDGHQHLIGAGGEEGFTSRMPEIPLSKIVCAGITTDTHYAYDTSLACPAEEFMERLSQAIAEKISAAFHQNLKKVYPNEQS